MSSAGDLELLSRNKLECSGVEIACGYANAFTESPIQLSIPIREPRISPISISWV